jgi:hypothetical protein
MNRLIGKESHSQPTSLEGASGGFLIVIFPTPHDGGVLSLKNKNGEQVFDSSNELLGLAPGESNITFVAFRSGLQLAVSSVTSGYLVILIYIIHHQPTDSKAEVYLKSQKERDLVRSLDEILSDSSFMPNGGKLAFSLSNSYPGPEIPRHHDAGDDDDDGYNRYEWTAEEQSGAFLRDLRPSLKGTDAAIFRACEQLHLAASLQYFIRYEGRSFACNYMPYFGNGARDGLDCELERKCQLLHGNPEAGWTSKRAYFAWATTENGLNKIQTPYSAADSPGYLEWLEGEPCIVADVEDIQGRGLLH